MQLLLFFGEGCVICYRAAYKDINFFFLQKCTTIWILWTQFGNMKSNVSINSSDLRLIILRRCRLAFTTFSWDYTSFPITWCRAATTKKNTSSNTFLSSCLFKSVFFFFNDFYCFSGRRRSFFQKKLSRTFFGHNNIVVYKRL